MPEFVVIAVLAWFVGMPFTGVTIVMLFHDWPLGIATATITCGVAFVVYGAYNGEGVFIGTGLLMIVPSFVFARGRHDIVRERQRLGLRR